MFNAGMRSQVESCMNQAQQIRLADFCQISHECQVRSGARIATYPRMGFQ